MFTGFFSLTNFDIMKHTASFTLICYLAFVVNFALSKKLTDLEIDNHPCKPEVIKVISITLDSGGL